MKVCVFGAGAVGGHLGARLAAKKLADVSVVARGAQLEAIRSRGLTLKSGGEEIHGMPACVTDDPASLPPQDFVLVAMKAYTLPALADTLARLVAPTGAVVFFLNGIPWWWRQGGRGTQAHLPLLDPEATLWSKLREKALGCVVYSPNDIVSPGVILHRGGNRYVMGEPNGSASERVRAIVDLFSSSGLPAEVSPDLRAEIWRKLTSNASSNPLSALTRLSIAEIGADDGLRSLSIAIKNETLAVAAAMGWDLRSELEAERPARRPAPAGSTPRPSMMQDVLLGRRLEVDSHLGQTQAFAREVGVPVPHIDIVLAMLRGLDRGLREGAGARL
jgi:2-dehydropantoate 2-reductase